MAAADKAELLALSDPRNPYPDKLGVVEPGALGRSAASRRRPAREHQIDRGPSKEPPRHHELTGMWKIPGFKSFWVKNAKVLASRSWEQQPSRAEIVRAFCLLSWVMINDDGCAS
jgi:hypothetical protein